eukprot:2705746-Pyramimonas_sp.AAC.1
MKGSFGRVPPPRDEWRVVVGEILDLYMEVTDPKLKFCSSNLDFAEKCQASTRVAEVHGHSWIPFTGEDLATMSAMGEPVADFFRPLTKMKTGHSHRWSCSIHVVSDSTI